MTYADHGPQRHGDDEFNITVGKDDEKYWSTTARPTDGVVVDAAVISVVAVD
jgi:hypothetical protein